MPMRENCKHFQSRTYATGEVVRFCELDLAPEAPWRCPDNCQSFKLRLADAGWVRGGLVDQKVEDEPGPGGPDVFHLLEEAEDIIDAVVPQTLAEVQRSEREAQRTATPLRRRWPWRRR